MKRTICLPHYQMLFGVLLFALAQPIQATTDLGLTTNYPDFFLGSGQTFTYDANCDDTFLGDCTVGQGKLTVTGGVSTYTEDPNGGIVNATVTVGAFSLVAILDIAGATVISGSFTLDGVVRDPFPDALYDGADHPSGNLLNGDLVRFGYAGDSSPSTGGILEFTFENAGGYIADPLFPLQELGAADFSFGGMILSVTSTNELAAGTFGTNALTTDWTGTGTGDVFVPIPAAAWLFGSGLIALLGLGRRRSIS